IDGKGGSKLEAVPAGASANLQLFADQTTVRSLSVEGNQVNGTVAAVDAAAPTITIGKNTDPVSAGGPPRHQHRKSQPGEPPGRPAGANVSLKLQVDQKTAQRVDASGGSDFGQVKAVDAVNNTITVTGGPPTERVYTVPADAPIRIDGKPGKLADVPVGAGLH